MQNEKHYHHLAKGFTSGLHLAMGPFGRMLEKVRPLAVTHHKYVAVREFAEGYCGLWFKLKENYCEKMSVSDDYFMDYVDSVLQSEGERVVTRTQSMFHDAGYGLGLSVGVLADVLSAPLLPAGLLVHDIVMTRFFRLRDQQNQKNY